MGERKKKQGREEGSGRSLGRRVPTTDGDRKSNHGRNSISKVNPGGKENATHTVQGGKGVYPKGKGRRPMNV